MSKGARRDEYGEIVDWLHERGKQSGRELPEFDVDKTISRGYAARYAGAINFWNDLSLTERNAFERAARRQVFRPGTELMHEGEPAEEVFVILDGSVKVCLAEDGRERVITERGPGDLIGEGGIKAGNLRSASVIALDTVQALVMTTAGYTAFVADHPGVPDRVMKLTYDRQTGTS
jgi:CRP-like cAMP-binding protein